MIYALMFAMQAATPQPALNNTPTPWPDQERELRSAGAFDQQATPEARLMMTRYAKCVVAGSPDRVAELLTLDFRSSAYRNGARSLQRANETCSGKIGLRGSLRMGELPIMGAFAEELMARDPVPLNVRLARAASDRQPMTFGPSDALAHCVARTVPDDVAALFASEPGSEGEASKLVEIEKVANLCARGRPIEISPLGLRSIIATASYRLLANRKS